MHQNSSNIYLINLLTMTLQELIKYLKNIEKTSETIYWERKDIQIKIWKIENGEYSEDDLILQNIMESVYDWKHTVILNAFKPFYN